MRLRKLVPIAVLATAFGLVATSAYAVQLSSTNFGGFTPGSVDGQGGWSFTNPNFDQEVQDDGTGNTVWRFSNDFSTGSFGDQGFAPRPGGTGMTSVDPVNSMPGFFAGESSTGAAFDRFYGQFDFRSAVNGTQDSDLLISVSADNGQGGRQSYVGLRQDGSGGLEIITYDVNAGGGFDGPIVIATGLSLTDWTTVGMEVLYKDGPQNDEVNYFVNGSLVHTGTSWEQFYAVNQPVQHPLGVPSQTLIFLARSGSNTADGGFFFDDVYTEVTNQDVPEPATLSLLVLGLPLLIAFRRRRSA